MKYKVILFIFTCFLSTSYAAVPGSCEIDNAPGASISWDNLIIRLDTPINDIDTLNLSFPYKGSADIVDLTGDVTYIDVVVEGMSLVFTTKPAFADIDNDIAKITSGQTASFSVTFNLTCDAFVTSNKMTFVLDVADTNNNPPTFPYGIYEYTMPMPLVPNIDLTYFGEPIIAQDIDFSNTDVTFAIESDLSFTMGTEKSDDSKEYRATIILTEFKRLTQDTSLTITATDNGSPPKTGTTTISIKIDTDVSLPDIPTVPEASYKFKYSTDDGGKPVLTPDGDPIIVTTTDPTKIEVSLEGVDPYFAADYDSTTQEVTIVTTETPIDLTNKQTMVGTLTISLIGGGTGDTGKAAILIDIPSDHVVNIPTFSAPYYTAKYLTDTDPHTVQLDADILVTEDPEIVLEGDEEHFTITFDENKWHVNVLTSLDDDVIKKGGDFPLVLHASVTDSDNQLYEGFATLIIQLPEVVPIEVPKFSQPYYTANYNTAHPNGDPDTVEITNGPIVVEHQDQIVTVSILASDTNSGHFSIAPNGENNAYEVTVKSNLDDPTLISEVDIVLTLQASVDGVAEIGKSTLVIKLPKKVAPAVFSQSYYEADYIMDTDTHSIKLRAGTIVLDGNNLPETHVTLDGEQKEHFQISDTSPYQLTLVDNLPDDIIKQQQDVVITLVASLDGSDLTTTATVIIIIPDASTPTKFSAVTYTAKYEITGDPADVSLEGNQVISVVASDPRLVTVTMDGPNSEHFAIALNADNTYDLSVTTKLEDDILISEVDIILTLQAHVEGVEAIAESTLVIKLPKEVAPAAFSQSYYQADYIMDTDTHSIKLTAGSIALNGNNLAETHVFLDGDQKEHFQISDTSPYELTLVDNLPDDVITQQQDVVIILVASLDGSDLTTTAPVIITIPDAPTPPKFSAITYTAKYEITDAKADVTLEGEQIIFTDASDPTLVSVSITGPNSDHFTIVLNADNTRYDLSVTTNLEDDILIGEVDIVLTLQASVDGIAEIGESTLVIKLPKEVAPAAFSQSYYEADYIMDTDTHSIKLTAGSITLNGNNLDETHVTLDGDQKEHFQISDTRPYELTLVDNLPDDIINGQHDVVIILIASLDGSNLQTTAPVLVKIPDVPRSPKFLEATYKARYEIDEGTPAINFEDDQTISTDAQDPSSVIATVEGTYSSNFELVYDDSQKTYTVEVSAPLDEDTVDKQSEIYVTLKATVDRATDSNLATLVITMPENTENVLPTFSKSYYTATYIEADDEANPDTVEIPQQVPITIISDQAADTTVKVLEPYDTNFEPTFDGNSWQLTVTKRLDSLILNEEKDIFVILEASLSGSAGIGHATLIINLPNKGLKQAPKFADTSYIIEYQISDDGEHSIHLKSNPIAIASAEEELVDVTLEDYVTNFILTRDDELKQWKIELGANLDDNTLKSETELVISINAHLAESMDDGTATLLVKLPPKIQEIIAFDQAFYKATYIVDDENTDTLDVEDITVNSGADVVPTGDHSDNFEISCEDTKCTLAVKEDLTADDLSTESEILIVLEATKQDITDKGTATVIISLPLKETLKAPEFTEPVYTASYTLNGDGTGNLEIDQEIKIAGVDDVAQIQVTVETVEGENQAIFTARPEGDHYVVEATNIPSDVIDNEISLVLNLKATRTDVSVPGLAGFVVKLPKKIAPSPFHFENNVYMADYLHQAEDIIQPEKSIQIEGDTDGTPATLDVTGDYKDNFEWSYDAGVVTINLKTPLPSNVLDEFAAVTLDLTATKNTDIATATLVIRLPKSQNSGDGLQFSQIAYTATYSVNDGTGQIALDNNIKINGIDDLTQVNMVIESGDSDNNFIVAVDGDHWLLNLQKDLPANVIVDEISLLLTLKATQDDLSGEAAVVVKLPKKLSPASFTFNDVVYTATYNDNDTPSLTPDQDIVISGAVDGVDVSLDGDNIDHFSLEFHQDNDMVVVTITLESPLPDEILNTQSIISFNILAHKTGPDGDENTKTAFVVKLSNSQGSGQTLDFTQVAYIANYEVTEDTDQVTFEDASTIQINGIDDPTQVTLVIEGDLSDHFALTTEGDHWTLTVSSDLPTVTLGEEISILLNLQATQGALSGKAAVVIKLPKKVTPATFNFEDVVYMADYKVDGDSVTFTLEDDIVIEGDQANIAIVLDGDYAEYFEATITDRKVSITRKGKLPSDVLNKQAAISVDILAVKGGETVKAACVIRLPKNLGNGGNGSGDGDNSGDDKTGLIAAIAVLAVLLVASLVGSAVFYYLKFKRTTSYANMEDNPRLSERFRKNSNGADTKHKFDHPTRRPTGVIKHSLDDTVADETTTDAEPSFEKRKSVQFDTINIDEMEIEPEKLDDDLDIDENEDEDDSYETVDTEDRRTSRV